MQKFINHSLKEYCVQLSAKTPVPGGGSAAALSAAVAVSLIAMVARYSLGKSRSASIDSKINDILKKAETIRDRMLELVDEDAEAYLSVVKARKGPPAEKRKALKAAVRVPKELGSLCVRAVNLTPYLVKNGNMYLLSDIGVAVEMLASAHVAAALNVAANRPERKKRS